MRKLLILSALALLSAGASGCTGGNLCGSMRHSLFGGGRNQQPTMAYDCCDPCGGTSYGVQSAPVMQMQAAPCCQ